MPTGRPFTKTQPTPKATSIEQSPISTERPSAVVGVLLAGGRARRMGGGDKALQTIAGRPMLDLVIERAWPQVSALVINAGGDAARFASFGLPVAADVVGGFAGPLAGVLTGMMWARANAPQCRWIVSIATDTPLFPHDLVARLLVAVADDRADLACAASGGRAHPVFGLWPLRLLEDLRVALVEEGMRKIDAWTARYRLATVSFDADPCDPFFNVNTPEELEDATRLLDSARDNL